MTPSLAERVFQILWDGLREQCCSTKPHTAATKIVMLDEADIKSIVPAVVQELATTPIDMILHCEACGLQHVDAPDERTPEWNNPPHKSHLCHGCGYVWRPADVPTNGVRAIQTKGSNDNPPSHPAPHALPQDLKGEIEGLKRSFPENVSAAGRYKGVYQWNTDALHEAIDRTAAIFQVHLAAAQGIVDAVSEWASDHEGQPNDPSDATLLKAMWTHDGDRVEPCPECDGDCGEPCAPLSVKAAHRMLDVWSDNWRAQRGVVQATPQKEPQG